MASNLKAARQSLDVARPTRASQAKSRRSTMGGSVQNVQGRLVHPRWNINTRISSPTETTDQKTETADQKIKRFRRREEVLRCVSNHSTNPTRNRSFSDLPAEILSQILEKLDPISRLVARNVSRTLRSIVDSQKPNINIIHLFEYSKRIEFGRQRFQQDITFIQMKDWCTVRQRRKTTNVRGGNYVDLTLQFLKPILFNPKLKLSRLRICFKEGSEFIQRLFDLMSDVVKTNNSQLHVGSLDIDRCTEKKSDSWLPLFKAGVLHNLEVAVDTRRGVVNCLESEQFKRAKSIDFIQSGGLEPSLINHFLHFDSFRVLLQFIPINDILRLMENLSTSNTFKRCEIKVLVDLDLDAIEEAFEVLPADPIQQEGRLYVEVHYAQAHLLVNASTPTPTQRTEDQAVAPHNGATPANTGSGFFTKKKKKGPQRFWLRDLRDSLQEEDKSSPENLRKLIREKFYSINNRCAFFEEVEYWVMMLEIEELEFEHRNNPNRRLFSDLPAEILSQILGNLDPVSRLVIRNVSRSLQSIVDSEKPIIKFIELIERPLCIKIRFSRLEQNVTFQQKNNWCSVYWREKNTIVRGGNYVNLALQFLKPLLSNPKLKLGRINIELNENSSLFQKLFGLMSEIVKTNNTQFHVKNLGIGDYTEEQLDCWLPLFKSGVLHNLEVLVKTGRGVVNCLESEHFKRAKSIDLFPIFGLNPSFINHFLHFETFRVHLQFILINDILRLMENLSTSDIFQRCDIYLLVNLDLKAIEEAFKVLPADPVKQEGLLYVEVNYVQFSLCFWFDERSATIQRKLEKH